VKQLRVSRRAQLSAQLRAFGPKPAQPKPSRNCLAKHSEDGAGDQPFRPRVTWGRLWAAASDGRGATFHFTLPGLRSRGTESARYQNVIRCPSGRLAARQGWSASLTPKKVLV
jgi:hypothetical protein